MPWFVLGTSTLDGTDVLYVPTPAGTGPGIARTPVSQGALRPVLKPLTPVARKGR